MIFRPLHAVFLIFAKIKRVPALEKISHSPWIQQLYPSCTWTMPAQEMPAVYLTFDDGPIPEVTPWVLDTLEAYKARATFFCIGENVKRNPEIFRQILQHGHSVGNHTLTHCNGWKTLYKKYLENVDACHDVFPSTLFRPPYGKLKPLQLRALRKKYNIIMWSHLTGDYNQNLNISKTMEDMRLNAGNGSIIVFHDSLKAEKNLRQLLPQTLDYFASQGYAFHSISPDKK